MRRFDDFAKVRPGSDFCKMGHYLHEETVVGRIPYFRTYVSTRGNRMCDICADEYLRVIPHHPGVSCPLQKKRG